MDADLHWSVWLLSGMAVGTVSGIGRSGVAGMLAGLAVLCSPVVIYMKAGAALLPFVLFYGGLVAMSSFFFGRRRASENAKLRGEIDQKKKRLSA